MDSAVLWLGDPRPPVPWSRRLAAVGLALAEVSELATAPALLRAMGPAVVLLAPGTDVRGVLLEAVSGATAAKLIAVVEKGGDPLAALGAGAHDAMSVTLGEEEAALRVMTWAKVAERERRQAGALASVADKILALEDRVREVEAERDHLRDLAHRDELTGLGNRRSFQAQLEWALSWSERYGGEVSVLLADLDGMKQLNDRCGHAAGDAALRTVAQVLGKSLRGIDHAARLGGDEYGVVMPRTGVADAARVAERVRHAIEHMALPARLRLTASFGVACHGKESGRGDATEIVDRADRALYAAKHGGKNRVVVDGEAEKAA